MRENRTQEWLVDILLVVMLNALASISYKSTSRTFFKTRIVRSLDEVEFKGRYFLTKLSSREKDT